MHTTDLRILGGGAAGLAAAIVAKQFYPEISVQILERNPRVGKKLLATGNGRCNLGNAYAASREQVYFGSVTQYLSKIQKETQDSAAFFRCLGLYTRQEADGRLYPCSNQATSVLDALRLTAQQLGVELQCDCTVTEILPTATGFQLQTSSGVMQANAVILTMGGMAAPQTGSDGNFLSCLQNLGIQITSLEPALTPVYTDPKLLKYLKGVRVHGTVSAISSSGEILAVEQGEIQFTSHALSGICVMNLTAKCVNHSPKWIVLNLFPALTESDVVSRFWELYAIRSQWKLEDWLTGLLPKKVALQLLYTSGIPLSFDAPVHQISPNALERVAKLSQNWRFPWKGRGEWNEAQVTSGGVAAASILPNLQAKEYPGMFFAGELLDLHGICGGYNLDWAWRSGQCAGKYAATWCMQNCND